MANLNFTYRLVIEYDGTRYHGWQEQANARTVAGELRGVACEVCNEKVDFGGAGRTDAGVHALGQVAHLRTSKRHNPVELQRSINNLLPADINVVRVEIAPPEFHARHDALARYYLYQLATQRTAFGKKYVWWIKDHLDLRQMRKAAEHFVGLHDFAHFSQPDPSVMGNPRKSESTRVDIHRLTIDTGRGMVYVRIGASHFLWKMVRRIVGTLVVVGQGGVSPDAIPELMRRGSPEIAAHTAPASGLFLERIEYPGDPKSNPTAPKLNIPSL